jgi:invasion protein IalB
MRNTLIGAGLAAILIVALFAAAHYGSRPTISNAPQTVLNPEQIAAQIKPNFIGEQAFGSWKLVCGPERELPKAPPTSGQSGNSSGTTPANAIPPGWKIPRCRVLVGLRNPKKPDREVRITFRGVGVKRTLAVFLRFPPDELQTGDTVTLRVDSTEWPVTVNSCGSYFCLAIRSIKFADLPALENSRQMQLAFKPAGGSQPIAVPVPVSGLTQAIKVMQRIDK